MENKALAVIDERIVLGKQFRIYGTFDNPLFLAKDVAMWIEHSNPSQMIEEAELDETETVKDFIEISYAYGNGSRTRKQESLFLTEDGILEVLMQSKKKIAKQYKKEIKTILKTIRKTGGYIANEDVFTETYLPFADEQTKSMFKLNLQIITQQNKVIADQKKELEYQSSVIEGFTDNISLTDKRRRITQIIRHNTPSPVLIGKRWNLLYGEFEKKYHMNLEARMTSEKYAKLKLKNKVDLIERGLNMTSELYGVACKLFESDYNSLLKEWSVAVNA